MFRQIKIRKKEVEELFSTCLNERKRPRVKK